MTDKQILVEMLTRAGVEFRPAHPADAVNSLIIEANGNGTTNLGYLDCYTSLLFDDQDALIAVGSWE